MNNNVGNIVFRQAGFLGSLNDAGNFKLMERIGPSTNYEMPPDVVLLADKGGFALLRLDICRVMSKE